jgi:mannose-6-phosphate isomerase
MFSFDPSPIEQIKDKYFCEPRVLKKQNQSTEYTLIDEEKTPCFRVNRIDVQDHLNKESDSFYIGIVSKGSGTITIEDQTYTVTEGMKFFIPYQVNAVSFDSESGMEIIATAPPR